MCRLIRVGDFGLTKDNQKGSRKRKRFREEEKAARKGYAFLKKHSEKSGFRRKDEVTGDAVCRKFVKRKGVGQNAIPSQNETKLILLLSVVIVLLLTTPVNFSAIVVIGVVDYLITFKSLIFTEMQSPSIPEKSTSI